MVEGLGLGLGGSPGPQGWADRGPAAHFPAPPLGSWATLEGFLGEDSPIHPHIFTQCAFTAGGQASPAHRGFLSSYFLDPPPLARGWGGSGRAEAQNSRGEKLQRGLEVAEDPRALGVSSRRAGEGAEALSEPGPPGALSATGRW